MVDDYKANFKLVSETDPLELMLAKFQSKLKFSLSFQRCQADLKTMNKKPSKSFVIGLKCQPMRKRKLGHAQ